MTKPTPEPVQPEQVVTLALAVIQADRFPYLATIDGDQPRVRPVSPVRTDGFTVYVANLRDYHKTAEIEEYTEADHGKRIESRKHRIGEGGGMARPLFNRFPFSL